MVMALVATSQSSEVRNGYALDPLAVPNSTSLPSTSSCSIPARDDKNHPLPGPAIVEDEKKRSDALQSSDRLDGCVTVNPTEDVNLGGDVLRERVDSPSTPTPKLSSGQLKASPLLFNFNTPPSRTKFFSFPTLPGSLNTPTSETQAESPLVTISNPTSPIAFTFAPEIQAEAPRMIFSEFQRSQALAHRRRAMATTNSITEYEADLTSKDRERQKKAIKELLAGKIRDDWEWTWPPSNDPIVEERTNGYEASEEGATEEDDSGSEAEAERWIERTEWASNDSVIEDASTSPDPFVESSDNPTLNAAEYAGWKNRSEAELRKARRRKRLLKEMEYNEGMKCFTHRRNAWTGARHVRRTVDLGALEKAARRESTASMNPLRRILSRGSTHSAHKSPPQSPSKSYRSAASVSPTQSRGKINHVHSQPQSTTDFIQNWLLQIPLPPPILPASTPMRKNVNEKAYGHIYDKVVLQSQTPYCPINLKVVVASCVEGWKRDGEWPPAGDGAVNGGATSTRMGTGLSFARRDGSKAVSHKTNGEANGDGKKVGIKRSLQKLAGRFGARAGSRGEEVGPTDGTAKDSDKTKEREKEKEKP